MRKHSLFAFIGVTVICQFLACGCVFADGSNSAGISDPCSGRGSLLSILDRPTVSDSSCSVKPGKVVLETGAEDILSDAEGGSASQWIYPYAELRIGLKGNNEIKFFPPNYNILSYPGNSLPSSNGFSDAGIGFKHEFGYTENLTYSADVLATFPSGSGGFQNYGTDFTLNGQLTYALTDGLSVEFAPGFSSSTSLSGDGSPHRFLSFNPDIVAVYQFNPFFQAYGEIFRNYQQGVAFSGNYWFDGGFQYLASQNLELDIEYGVYIDPPPGNSSRYIGFGTGIMF